MRWWNWPPVPSVRKRIRSGGWASGQPTRGNLLELRFLILLIIAFICFAVFCGRLSFLFGREFKTFNSVFAWASSGFDSNGIHADCSRVTERSLIDVPASSCQNCLAEASHIMPHDRYACIGKVHVIAEHTRHIGADLAVQPALHPGTIPFSHFAHRSSRQVRFVQPLTAAFVRSASLVCAPRAAWSCLPLIAALQSFQHCRLLFEFGEKCSDCVCRTRLTENVWK